MEASKATLMMEEKFMALCILKEEHNVNISKTDDGKTNQAEKTTSKIVMYLNIIQLSGKLHVCPDLHETKEEAEKALYATLGKYRTPHLKFVTGPIKVEIEQME